jgi:hypothetical protein
MAMIERKIFMLIVGTVPARRGRNAHGLACPIPSSGIGVCLSRMAVV